MRTKFRNVARRIEMFMAFFRPYSTSVLGVAVTLALLWLTYRVTGTENAMIALPAWITLYLYVITEHRRRAAQMRRIGAPLRSLPIGGDVAPMDIDAIVRSEIDRVRAQVPWAENDPVVHFPNAPPRLPTKEELGAFDDACASYGADLARTFDREASLRLDEGRLWSQTLRWRHVGGEVLENVEVTVAFPVRSFAVASRADQGGDMMTRLRTFVRNRPPVRPCFEFDGERWEVNTSGVRQSGSVLSVEGRPQELHIGANWKQAMRRRYEATQDDIRVVVTADRLRYGDELGLSGYWPIEARTSGLHLVAWEILADQLARPICGKFLVRARPVREAGAAIRDLGAPAPTNAAARRLEMESTRTGATESVQSRSKLSRSAHT